MRFHRNSWNIKLIGDDHVVKYSLHSPKIRTFCWRSSRGPLLSFSVFAHGWRCSWHHRFPALGDFNFTPEASRPRWNVSLITSNHGWLTTCLNLTRTRLRSLFWMVLDALTMIYHRYWSELKPLRHQNRLPFWVWSLIERCVWEITYVMSQKVVSSNSITCSKSGSALQMKL